MAIVSNFRPRKPFKKEEPYRINGYITAPMVRIVGDNVEQEIVPLKRALEIADELGLDLVEISPGASPPVCKVVDYKKFLYEMKKKQKRIKANTQKVTIKEIRLGPNIDDHDFNFKLRHAINFLQDGSKVKVDVFFKGRMIIYKEKGEIILFKFAQELEEYGKVEQLPRLEGKRMIMIVAPKK